mmetsp:Transcript_14270/g.25383  ORF Transcript_14270/g.25383 Transcript_14270/m.25383 type:complete len:205 (+) Transcript_14270:1568-2182(+)
MSMMPKLPVRPGIAIRDVCTATSAGRPCSCLRSCNTYALVGRQILVIRSRTSTCLRLGALLVSCLGALLVSHSIARSIGTLLLRCTPHTPQCRRTQNATYFLACSSSNCLSYSSLLSLTSLLSHTLRSCIRTLLRSSFRATLRPQTRVARIGADLPRRYSFSRVPHSLVSNIRPLLYRSLRSTLSRRSRVPRACWLAILVQKSM